MRFGIIGTNFITEDFLTAAAECEDFTLTTVYSRTHETARAFADKWGAPDATDSLQALADSPEVDAVYIASPNVCHAQQALQMLRAGKHVLCEKPIAKDSAQLAELLDTARACGKTLLEAMRPAFLPSLEALCTAMEKIGPVRRAVISYCQYSSRYDKFKRGMVENAFDPTLCNGALMDIGVYCVHMMVMLFGPPQEICARGWFLPQSIDAAGTAICTYDKMHVQLAYSKVNQSHSPAEVQGERGTLFFEPAATPHTAWIEYNDGTREQLPFAVHPNDMLYEARQFIRIAEGREPAQMWHTWSRQAMCVMDEMRRQIGIDFLRKE